MKKIFGIENSNLFEFETKREHSFCEQHNFKFSFSTANQTYDVSDF